MNRPARTWFPARTAAWGIVACVVTTTALLGLHALAVRNRPAITGWSAEQVTRRNDVATRAFFLENPRGYIGTGRRSFDEPLWRPRLAGLVLGKAEALRVNDDGAVDVLEFPGGRVLRTLDTRRPFAHVPGRPWSLLDLDPWSDTVNSWTWERPETRVVFFDAADEVVWTFASPREPTAAPIAHLAALDGGAAQSIRCLRIAPGEIPETGDARVLDWVVDEHGISVRFVTVPGPGFGVARVAARLHEPSSVSISPDARTVAVCGWGHRDGPPRPHGDGTAGRRDLERVLALHDRSSGRTTIARGLTRPSPEVAWPGSDEVWLISADVLEVYDRRTAKLLRTRTRCVPIVRDRLVIAPDEGCVIVNDRVFELPAELAARWIDVATCRRDTESAYRSCMRSNSRSDVAARVTAGALEVVPSGRSGGPRIERFGGTGR